MINIQTNKITRRMVRMNKLVNYFNNGNNYDYDDDDDDDDDEKMMITIGTWVMMTMCMVMPIKEGDSLL